MKRNELKKEELKRQIAEAMAACQDKKAESVAILEMEKESNAFTDYFLICSGINPRQVQAIADEVEGRLEKMGQRVTHKEGYNQAEWVLLDYVDFVVHIFSERARQYYDLERLWKTAKRLQPSDLKKVPVAAKKAPAKKAAPKKSAAKKPVVKKAATKKAATKKPATKKPAMKTSGAKASAKPAPRKKK